MNPTGGVQPSRYARTRLFPRVYGEIELGEDVSDLRLDGLARDEEVCGDAAVAHAQCHELENIGYAVGERAQPCSPLAVAY